MSREIKFRGKATTYDPMVIPNDGWVKGFYYQDLCNGEIKHFIKGGEMDWEVDEDTIGQFTGLHDKNGKEIYEGDILGTNERVIGWVKGGVRGYCYDVAYINHPAGESDWPLYGTVKYDYPGKIKVIGNIYDNKELLEGGFKNEE